MKEFVYYLICPIDNKVKYVGKSKNPKTRYKQHIKKLDKQSTPKREWLEKLFKKGLLPKMIIVEIFEGDARHIEQKHVKINEKTILNIHNPERGMKSRKWN